MEINISVKVLSENPTDHLWILKSLFFCKRKWTTCQAIFSAFFILTISKGLAKIEENCIGWLLGLAVSTPTCKSNTTHLLARF